MVAEAMAQTSPNFLVAVRKGAMNPQLKYFSPVLTMAQGGAPYDAAIVLRNAEYLSLLTQLAWDDFQPRTIGLANTRAKEDIYKDPAKFKAGIDTLQLEAKNLLTAARAGDRATVGSVARNIGRACNPCHEANTSYEFRFRLP